MIESIQVSDKLYQDRLKLKGFACPCGKSYYSYAALFTHIKIKHQGKAPGKIIKPLGINSKRGRPAHKSKKTEKTSMDIKTSQFGSLKKEFIMQNSLSYERKEKDSKKVLIQMNKLFNDIALILQELPNEIGKKIQLNQIEAFTEMIVIIKLFEQRPCLGNQKIMVYGLIQFLQKVCEKIQWNKFEQLYSLMILYLQFIIDEENTKAILKTATMDIFCEYINDFVQNHLQALAEYYEVCSMAILNQGISLRIFDIFFKWMMLNEYTAYKIQINNQVSRYIEPSHSQSFQQDII